MKYKLLVTDMDETLFNSQRKISKKNYEAIQELIKRGGHIALASGRTSYAMVKSIKEIGVESQKHIADNGATYFDLDGYNTTTAYLDKEDFKNICAQLKKHNIETTVNTREGIYHEGAYRLLETMEIFNADCPIMEKSLLAVNGAYLIYGKIDKKEDEEFMYSLATKETNAFLGSGFVIFMDRKSNKYRAGALLAKELGISEDEIICVGDGGNDLDMVKECKMGMAVNNAIDILKENAKVVLPKTNDEDAISYLIENYFF